MGGQDLEIVPWGLGLIYFRLKKALLIWSSIKEGIAVTSPFLPNTRWFSFIHPFICPSVHPNSQQLFFENSPCVRHFASFQLPSKKQSRHSSPRLFWCLQDSDHMENSDKDHMAPYQSNLVSGSKGLLGEGRRWGWGMGEERAGEDLLGKSSPLRTGGKRQLWTPAGPGDAPGVELLAGSSEPGRSRSLESGISHSRCAHSGDPHVPGVLAEQAQSLGGWWKGADGVCQTGCTAH